MKKKPSCCPDEKEELIPLCSDKSTRKKRVDYFFWVLLLIIFILYILGHFFTRWVSGILWLETMIHTTHHMIHSMWWGVVIGILFIGFLSKVPREFIVSILGKGGTLSGLLRAVGAGVLLDLCSHGILMVATKLYERGASAGQVIAFLLASPWNSFSLTLVLVGLIGLKWTLSFIFLSMVIALITGWIFDKLVEKKVLPSNQNQVSNLKDFNFFDEAKKSLKQTSFNFSFFTEMIGNGIKDSKVVVRWLLFGILLASILRVIFDSSQFEQYFGATFLGLMMTVFVATILEVCSEGSAPVAADIFTRAKSPGNSFAFLMTGVSTDYTEIMVLKDATKSWKLALFLPLITLPQVLVVAWLINIYG